MRYLFQLPTYLCALLVIGYADGAYKQSAIRLLVQSVSWGCGVLDVCLLPMDLIRIALPKKAKNPPQYGRS